MENPMINYKEIEEKIKAMSAHEIIMAMVEGLRSPRTEIDMEAFGGKIEGGLFYGCAGTNTLLHIMNASKEEVEAHIRYIIIYNGWPLGGFQYAIDCLRCGNPEAYNYSAERLGYAQITPIPLKDYPPLEDDYTENELQEYVKLAEYNK